MLDAIRSFISRRIPPVPEGAEGGRPPGIQLAACALLLELAHADGEFSLAEQRHIEGALIRHFGLDPATAAELMELAAAERDRSIDHFQFTRLIADQYDLGQKMVLAEVMWGLVLTDGTISEHEQYLTRKISNLLDLEPGYLSTAKASAEQKARGS